VTVNPDCVAPIKDEVVNIVVSSFRALLRAVSGCRHVAYVASRILGS
jgi:hypothetical protein